MGNMTEPLYDILSAYNNHSKLLVVFVYSKYLYKLRYVLACKIYFIEVISKLKLIGRGFRKVLDTKR